MKNKKEPPIKRIRLSQQLMNPDHQLWKQVKVAAIMEGKTMTEYVEEILKKHLAKKSGKEGDR